MKQSGIILSIIITVGVSACAYGFVTSLHPCAGDRSYECLFGDAIQNIQGSGGDIPIIQVVSTPQVSQVKQVNTVIKDQTTIVDTTLADQEAAAKLAKDEADAQRIAAEKATAKLAAEQAEAEKLVAEQAIKNPVVESSDRYEEEEEDDD